MLNEKKKNPSTCRNLTTVWVLMDATIKLIIVGMTFIGSFFLPDV